MPNILPLGAHTQLLTANKKQEMTYEVTGIVTAGLELQSGQVGSAINCPSAVREDLDCLKYCLRFAGNGFFPVVAAARLRRAELLRDDPKLFREMLNLDIRSLEALARFRGKELALRLNTFSDRSWTRTIKAHPDVMFFDYTKERSRFRSYLQGKQPENYHLTYSASERDSDNYLLGLLGQGAQVAVVFKGSSLPDSWLGHPVMDGDEHDARWLDGPGVVGLRAKGTLRSKDTNFSRKAA